MEQIIATKTQTVLFIQTIIERGTQAQIFHRRAVMAFLVKYLLIINNGRLRIIRLILHNVRAITCISRRKAGK